MRKIIESIKQAVRLYAAPIHPPEFRELDDYPLEYFSPEEINCCPCCGNLNRSKLHKDRWHCNICGFALCTYTKEEVRAIATKYHINYWHKSQIS